MLKLKAVKKVTAGVLAGAVAFTAVCAPVSGDVTVKAQTPYSGTKYVFATNYDRGIDVYGKDGTVKKTYQLIKDPGKPYSMGEIYRSKNYIYYCDTNVGYSDTGDIWQVPYDKKTNRLSIKKKKKLFGVENWEGFIYANDKKVVYLNKNTIVSYNKKKKKKTTLVKKSTKKNILLAKDANGLNAKAGNNVFYTVVNYYSSQKTDQKLYQLNLSTGKSKKIADQVKVTWQQRHGHYYTQLNPILGISGSYVYIPTESSVARYNVKKQKMTAFAGQDTTSSANTTIMTCLSANADVSDVLDWDIMNMYPYGSKLYLQVRVRYNYKGNDDESSSYDEKYVMLSMNRADGKEITYEKELSSFLADNGSGYKECDYDCVENWTRLTGGMIALTQKGVWIAEFVDKEGKFCYYTYNMSTNNTKTYPEAKAKLRLLKNGINDKEPIIC